MPLKIVNPACAARAAGLGNASSRGADGPEFYHKPNSLQAPRFEPRFRRQVEQLCRLGPFAVACLIEDIAAGKDVRETVSAYASLPAEFIATYGADRFPLHLRAIDGGAS